jgi:antitoxin (DNA-binding transcriptional repressor) of toxin-antitoxin stability system
MREIEASDAAMAFGKLLDRVQAGEEVAIRRNGVVVARLVPDAAGKRDAAPNKSPVPVADDRARARARSNGNGATTPVEPWKQVRDLGRP